MIHGIQGYTIQGVYRGTQYRGHTGVYWDIQGYTGVEKYSFLKNVSCFHYNKITTKNFY